MDYRKGILECIKAIKNIDAELWLACPNNDSLYLNTILTYIEAAGMQDKIKFLGWCMGERKENFLKSIDVLMIPSLYEPFGYVAIEAMTYGLPVISSNNGGLGEILEGYKYQYYPYNENELSEQIKAFQNDSNEVIEKQQKILINKLDEFSTEKMCEKYKEIWKSL